MRRLRSEWESRAKHAAFARRVTARKLLFGKGQGFVNNLGMAEKLFVQQVIEEAYQAYLHLFRTGESRYQGWAKRRQVDLVNKDKPMSKKKWYPMWFGSQKRRYFHYDLKRAING